MDEETDSSRGLSRGRLREVKPKAAWGCGDNPIQHACRQRQIEEMAADIPAASLMKGLYMLKALGIVGGLFFLAIVIALFAGMPHGVSDPLVLFSDGMHDHTEIGGWLGWLIAGFVMLLVGAILTFVFAGVSIVLVVVAFVVALVVLLALLPVLIPVVVILAIPLLVVYGLVKLVSGD